MVLPSRITARETPGIWRRSICEARYSSTRSARTGPARAANTITARNIRFMVRIAPSICHANGLDAIKKRPFPRRPQLALHSTEHRLLPLLPLREERAKAQWRAHGAQSIE